MTSIAYEQHPVRGVHAPRHATSLPLRSLARRIVAAWQLHRAERELEGLPFDIRKDIGFRAAERTTR
jgi:hypothetical protein